VIGFKSYKTRQQWYANAAQINLQIQKRGMRTKSGESPFRYFDGPTMVSYQLPHRTMEAVFCRRQPTPEACLAGSYNYDPAIPNLPASSFEVKHSGISENTGLGIFAKVDIPEGAHLSAETKVHAVEFLPSTGYLIENLSKDDTAGDAIDVFMWYMDRYGYSSQKFVSLNACGYGLLFLLRWQHELKSDCLRSLSQGDEECFVDSGILTFVNHGCRGSYNMGKKTTFDEFSADPSTVDGTVSGRSHEGTTTFNPVVDRHLRYMADRSLRDIKAGEEILDNYLAFVGKPEFWAKDVMNLRALCSGQAVEK